MVSLMLFVRDTGAAGKNAAVVRKHDVLLVF
jgi:hypothetical protein